MSIQKQLSSLLLKDAYMKAWAGPKDSTPGAEQIDAEQ